MPKGHADAVLIDAGTGNVPELTVHPDPAIPALVLLTPNARGSLEEMRGIGFAGYLVKPVRQSSLVTRLGLCRRDQPANSGEAAGPELPPVLPRSAPQAADASDPGPPVIGALEAKGAPARAGARSRRSSARCRCGPRRRGSFKRRSSASCRY